MMVHHTEVFTLDSPEGRSAYDELMTRILNEENLHLKSTKQRTIKGGEELPDLLEVIVEYVEMQDEFY